MPEIHNKAPFVDDDEDLDDLLDGALDDFSAPKATPVKPAASTKASVASPSTTTTSTSTSTATKPQRTPESLLFNPDSDDEDDGAPVDDDFSKQLAAGMEDLMKEMGTDGDFKKTFEEMFKGLDAGLGAPVGTAASASSAGKAPAGGSFQDRIAKTMDKLKDSSDQVDAEVAEDSEEALMAEMMKQMEGMADGGDFQNVLEGMMEQLMSKDILYEPMQDLAKKYPQWLKDNKGKIPEEDYARYEKQHGYVKEIVAFFDAPTFDEKNEAQSKTIIDLMQGMQDCGQPPASILDELAPGLEMSPDGVPKMPDMPDCNMQ